MYWYKYTIHGKLSNSSKNRICSAIYLENEAYSQMEPLPWASYMLWNLYFIDYYYFQ